MSPPVVQKEIDINNHDCNRSINIISLPPIMARILCIDYGKMRCGLAVTDPLQIIVNALVTVSTKEINDFVEKYLKEEQVEKVVIGWPTHKDGSPTMIADDITKFGDGLIKKFPELELVFVDESYSSVRAKQFIMQSGARRKKRQDKALVDRMSAVVILQEYLGHI